MELFLTESVHCDATDKTRPLPCWEIQSVIRVSSFFFLVFSHTTPYLICTPKPLCTPCWGALRDRHEMRTRVMRDTRLTCTRQTEKDGMGEGTPLRIESATVGTAVHKALVSAVAASTISSHDLLLSSGRLMSSASCNFALWSIDGGSK
jgi:hypothetical protein